MSVKNCQLVTFGKEAFSWLLALHVQNVGQLQLVSGTFALDPTAENIGMHGPGMTVSINEMDNAARLLLRLNNATRNN